MGRAARLAGAGVMRYQDSGAHAQRGDRRKDQRNELCGRADAGDLGSAQAAGHGHIHRADERLEQLLKDKRPRQAAHGSAMIYLPGRFPWFPYVPWFRWLKQVRPALIRHK